MRNESSRYLYHELINEEIYNFKNGDETNAQRQIQDTTKIG